MKFKNSIYLSFPATENSIKAYLIDVGVPKELIDTIDLYILQDPSLSVKEVLPSLISEYPSLERYIIAQKSEEQYQDELFRYLKDAIEKMVYRTYDDIEKEMLLDEFGTLDPYMLIGKIWEERLLPDEKIFELIDEFGLDLNRFGRLKEAYQSKKAITYMQEQKPVISSYLQDIVNSARENEELFFLDIGKLPKELNKETAIKHLPTILVLGTDKELHKLEKLADKYPEVFDWIYNEFPRALDILKEVKKGNIGELFALPDIEYRTVKKMFPKTVASFERLYKPVYLKTTKELAKRVEVKKETPPQPQPQIIGFIIPKPKKERISWKGIDLGEVDKGYDVELYGKMVAEHNLKWLRQRFSEEEIKKGIEYVKRRFPHLNPNTQLFWSTVENTILTKGWIEDEIFKD